MVWKILSGVTAACLAGSCYFAFENGKQVKAEKELRSRAEANLASLTERKQEASDAKDRKVTKVASLEKQRDDTKEDVVSATAEAQEKEASLALLKGNLDQVTQQVTALEKKIEDAGDIEKLLAQVESLKKDEVAAQGALANKEQQLANANSKVDQLVVRKGDLEDLQARMTRGVVDADFSARVSGVFPTWGFVVLNKGNSQGAFANALLNVTRGQDVIAKLQIKNVEPNISVADVVDGTLADGMVIQSGDMVVADPEAQAAAAKAREGTGGSTAAPAETGDAPAAPTEAPAPEAPMQADPFGAPPAGDAPMQADPFGDPPAGDAPMQADPFGDPPAGDAPMQADPFGN